MYYAISFLELPNKLSATAVANIKQMKQEFAKRRKIIVTNSPVVGEQNAKQVNRMLYIFALTDAFDLVLAPF